MLPIGMLGDRYGHKRLLVTGIALFGAGSLADLAALYDCHLGTLSSGLRL